ncbi:GMC oxidoreductase [Sphingomonas aracearum]|uniref:GMC family oxidoreductase n=1 Tax=Sphingomonas aracearum TaxID=2283317 RepID=A0A369VWR8_9SPHN|nr:GMC family oxidoreductase [Sphingomonas aracearum]RDE06289.1 GMC family oxidoreductase [Sphingomonas aracearum]
MEPDIPGSCDVLVIGSGAGGGTIALRLAQGGAKVLLVDSGGQLASTPPGPGEPIGTYIRQAYPKRGSAVSQVGGQTKFYGGALYRLRERDFGELAFANGVSPGWPITYRTLEPYYAAAERLYGVHGDGASDPTEPRRSGAYPYPPVPYPPEIDDVRRRLSATGVPVTPIPRGLDVREGRGACRVCSTCDGHHCRLDAKLDAEIAAVRPALATGNATLLAGTSCTRILLDRSGKRAGGAILQRGAVEYSVGAETVVLACGVPRTAQLLQRSRARESDPGLGNAGGALGRYLGGHSAGVLFPLIGRQSLGSLHTKSFALNHLYFGDDDWPYPLGVIQTAGQMPFWSELPPGTRTAARFVAGRALTCFHMSEALPGRNSGLFFDGDRISHRIEPEMNHSAFNQLRRRAVRVFSAAGYLTIAPPRRPALWHQTGTARMGEDAAMSVVSPDLEVHGVKNLFVADASVLPSAGAVNTSLTIMALALRCGDHILGQRTCGGAIGKARAASSPARRCSSYTAG